MPTSTLKRENRHFHVVVVLDGKEMHLRMNKKYKRNVFYISGKINRMFSSVKRKERRNCKLKFSFLSKRGVMNGVQGGYTDYTVY